MIKHISFDLWLTLIRSNPEFKPHRAEIIAKTFETRYSPKEIEKIVQETDKVFDRYNMINDCKLSANEMYTKVLQKVVSDPGKLTMADGVRLRKIADELFNEFPPVFLNENIPHILSALKDKGYTINLSSNTGFIEGHILRNTLANMKVSQYFDFLIFSDEIDSSKPSPDFFGRIIQKTGLSPDHILHIGDNPIADYKGALDSGMKAMLITDSFYTIEDIKEHLAE